MQEIIQEKDIFRGYEITGWKFSPRIYKILGISAISNLLFLFVFAQANLLTTKGCDSPFVGTVCQVIDTIYVGKTLFGADSTYEDFEVDPTVIREEDITFIDMSNASPQLKYPEGYFVTANPDQYFMDENGVYQPIAEGDQLANLTNPNPISPISPINPVPPPYTPSNPSRSNGGITSKPQNAPDPTAGGVSGVDPDSPFRIGGGDRKNPGPPGTTSNNNPDGGETAGTEPVKTPETAPEVNTDPVEDIRTNKRPFKELAPVAQTTFDFDPNNPEDTVDLKPFKVVLNGTLTKKMIEDENGEKREVIGFDAAKTTFVQIRKEEAGDPATVELAKRAIMAVGDSGFLGYAYNLGLKEIKITISQVGDKIIVNFESVQTTEQRAKTLAQGLGGLLIVADQTVRAGTNERILVDNALRTPPTSRGNKIIMNIEIPVDVVEAMIKKNLEAEAEELKKKNSNKPNSTAQTVNLNQQSGR